MPTVRPSPFLDPGACAQDGQLALLALSRENLTPVVLNASPDADSDYAEGAVINTRFGSFPHSALVNVPWGTQVRALNVDTGRRGRKGGKKRKRGDDAPGDDEDSTAREIGFASTGFAHLMPPTPETWTISLPHRTQVVYTPDYSYVLQRLRARPGDTLIEAGAGSGSFTHASVRAVFNGYPLSDDAAAVNGAEKKKRRKRHGHIYSFEFHEPRAQQLRKELEEHGLEQLVTVTHADVYADGFSTTNDGTVPQADAVFLDLPAPWLALKHLVRNRGPAKPNSTNANTPKLTSETTNPQWRSPLNPRKAVRICTFSPCIEQVQRTTSEMRRLGWIDIEMVEVQHKRIEVRRDRIGLHEEGLRGVNATPATVDEAVGRLRDVEGRIKMFHDTMHGSGGAAEGSGDQAKGWGKESKLERLERIKAQEKQRKTFKEGRLVHRTEPEIKTHTSYLCFALLPREWTEEDEQKARQRWSDAGVQVQSEKAEVNDENK